MHRVYYTEEHQSAIYHSFSSWHSDKYFPKNLILYQTNEVNVDNDRERGFATMF